MLRRRVSEVALPYRDPLGSSVALACGSRQDSRGKWPWACPDFALARFAEQSRRVDEEVKCLFWAMCGYAVGLGALVRGARGSAFRRRGHVSSWSPEGAVGSLIRLRSGAVSNRQTIWDQTLGGRRGSPDLDLWISCVNVSRFHEVLSTLERASPINVLASWLGWFAPNRGTANTFSLFTEAASLVHWPQQQHGH